MLKKLLDQVAHPVRVLHPNPVATLVQDHHLDLIEMLPDHLPVPIETDHLHVLIETDPLLEMIEIDHHLVLIDIDPEIVAIEIVIKRKSVAKRKRNVVIKRKSAVTRKRSVIRRKSVTALLAVHHQALAVHLKVALAKRNAVNSAKLLHSNMNQLLLHLINLFITMLLFLIQLILIRTLLNIPSILPVVMVV